MHLSARGAAELIGSEAIVTRLYYDSVRVPTVGVGHTKAAGAPNPLDVRSDRPVEEWIALFRKDVERYAADVTKALKVPVTQYEFDALVSFHFNTGAIGRASLVKRLNAGASRQEVGALFMSWVKPVEITERRRREMNLFLTGRYSDDPKASVYPASDAGAVLWAKGRRVSVLPLLGADIAPLPVLPKGRAILRRGSRGSQVAEWQEVLRGVGFKLEADGDFGEATERLTKQWQAKRGLVNDGVVGAKTWAKAATTTSSD